MELKEFYKQAIEDQFKANAVIDAVEKKIEDLAKTVVFNKYKDEIIFKDELEFELFLVIARTNRWRGDLDVREIDISMYYACKSKLPKAKRERVEVEKKNLLDSRFFSCYPYKIPLWHSFNYKIDIDKIILGNFNLSR